MSQNVSSAAVVVFAFPKIAKSKISQWLTFVDRKCLRGTFLNGKRYQLRILGDKEAVWYCRCSQDQNYPIPSNGKRDG